MREKLYEKWLEEEGEATYLETLRLSGVKGLLENFENWLFDNYLIYPKTEEDQ